MNSLSVVYLTSPFHLVDLCKLRENEGLALQAREFMVLTHTQPPQDPRIVQALKQMDDNIEKADKEFL